MLKIREGLVLVLFVGFFFSFPWISFASRSAMWALKSSAWAAAGLYSGKLWLSSRWATRSLNVCYRLFELKSAGAFVTDSQMVKASIVDSRVVLLPMQNCVFSSGALRCWHPPPPGILSFTSTRGCDLIIRSLETKLLLSAWLKQDLSVQCFTW